VAETTGMGNDNVAIEELNVEMFNVCKCPT
jgi:hypothetical protein